jgi:ribosomal protein S12
MDTRKCYNLPAYPQGAERKTEEIQVARSAAVSRREGVSVPFMTFTPKKPKSALRKVAR